jgi:hypothetical protein
MPVQRKTPRLDEHQHEQGAKAAEAKGKLETYLRTFPLETAKELKPPLTGTFQMHFGPSAGKVAGMLSVDKLSPCVPRYCGQESADAFSTASKEKVSKDENNWFIGTNISIL